MELTTAWVKKNTLLSWDELPEFMKNDTVRPYWEALWKHRLQLILKRAFDVVLSEFLIMFLSVPMIIIACAVKLDSPGPVLFRQVRITQYGRKFRICKFRTMYDEASKKGANGQQVGSAITVKNDCRVTKVGKVLRKYRLDEVPQLFNVIVGDMTFVGTRPEVEKYVSQYLKEWIATLLLPAGITSEASIRYKDENSLLDCTDDVDIAYMNKILPGKMLWNLKSIKEFSVFSELRTLIGTVFAIGGKK